MHAPLLRSIITLMILRWLEEKAGLVIAMPMPSGQIPNSCSAIISFAEYPGFGSNIKNTLKETLIS